MTKGAVRNVRHTKLLGSIDQAVCLVKCLKRRVLCLEGINFGDYFRLSVCKVELVQGWTMLTSIGLAQSFRRTF